MTRVVFFGNERLISGLEKTEAPILKGLIERGYEVVAIVSHHSHTNSRNKRVLEVAAIAEKHDIPVYLPNKPSEIIDELKGLNAEIAVLAAYGRIISQKVIDIFPMGIINIHPSLLPKYRGPTPIESALLNGDSETGVSIMKLTAGMDEGPVFAQATVAIEDSEEKFHLYKKIVDASTQLFFEVFPKIIDGSLQPTPQDADQATYSKLIDKTDSVVDWNKPAIRIVNEIRAYAGWPQSKTTLGDVDVIITKAHVSDEKLDPGTIAVSGTEKLVVGAAEKSVAIDSIKPLGKKEMPVSAFLVGYGARLKD